MSCWQMLRRTKGGHISLDIYTTLPVSGCNSSCWVKFVLKDCFPALLGDSDHETITAAPLKLIENCCFHGSWRCDMLKGCWHPLKDAACCKLSAAISCEQGVSSTIGFLLDISRISYWSDLEKEPELLPRLSIANIQHILLIVCPMQQWIIIQIKYTFLCFCEKIYEQLEGISARSSLQNWTSSEILVGFLTWMVGFIQYFYWIKVNALSWPFKNINFVNVNAYCQWRLITTALVSAMGQEYQQCCC